MPLGRSTFSKFIIEDQRRRVNPDPDLTGLLNDIQTACKFIASAVSRGMLMALDHAATNLNVQGEIQKPLDIVANEIVVETCEWGGQLCGMVSEEMDEPYLIPPQYPKGRYLLLFDPLDGSSNIDVNVTVGSIFSVLCAPPGVTDPTTADFLQPGTNQVAAGFALYGPTSIIVITLGAGVHTSRHGKTSLRVRICCSMTGCMAQLEPTKLTSRDMPIFSLGLYPLSTSNGFRSCTGIGTHGASAGGDCGHDFAADARLRKVHLSSVL